MVKLIFTYLLFFSVLSFGQQTLKKIRGFVFENVNYTNINMPLSGAQIQIKGKDIKTETNFDGYYEILINERDTLIISSINNITTKEIYTTNINCYNITFSNQITDGDNFYISKKNKRRLQKSVRKVKQKMESGYFECKD